MKLLERRREADRAERRLRRERATWIVRTAAIRAWLGHHRAAATVGGGFAGGMLAGMLPLRGFARMMRTLGSLTAFALRMPLGALLADAAIPGARAPDAARGPPREDAA